MSLIGAGIGVCFAHISSWSIAAARPGEGVLTASAIPTIQALGIAFGAAVAGLVAKTASLTADISPAALTVLAWRLVWLHRHAPLAQKTSLKT